MEHRVKERARSPLLIVFLAQPAVGQAGPNGVSVALTAPRFGSDRVSAAQLKWLPPEVFQWPRPP
uniref:Uncharacterized protein n=1 Tax=Anopheles stephensi TaxID=30069 RepID=A0A182YMT4_ANOST